MKPLSQLDLPGKLLFSMFLLVLSCGFVVAELYLHHTTEFADGKPGLGMDDITAQFHGKGTPVLKLKVLGSMKKYFSESQSADNLKKDEEEDIARIVAWVDKGAPEAEYEVKKTKEMSEDDFSAKKKVSISAILSNRGCIDCHARDSVMRHNMHDYPLETYADVMQYGVTEKGMDTGRLLALSHIHLLGMGMMFMLLGLAVSLTQWPVWLRAALIVGAHSSILLDIFGWWGVKWFGAPLSPVVMAGGVLMGVSFGISVFISYWDLWIRKPKAEGKHSKPDTVLHSPEV